MHARCSTKCLKDYLIFDAAVIKKSKAFSLKCSLNLTVQIGKLIFFHCHKLMLIINHSKLMAQWCASADFGFIHFNFSLCIAMMAQWCALDEISSVGFTDGFSIGGFGLY